MRKAVADGATIDVQQMLDARRGAAAASRLRKNSHPPLPGNKRTNKGTRACLLAFLFYLAAFAVLYDYVGDGMIALSAFPIIVCGHLYGRWGGVLAGLTLAFVNYQLLDNAGRWPGPMEPGVPFAFASLALVGIGLQAGFFGESRRKVESEIQQRERTEQQLRSALEEVHTLRGIVPICAGCKQIRKDDGSWVAVERFIQERSEASFSHGVCPKCAAEQGLDA